MTDSEKFDLCLQRLRRLNASGKCTVEQLQSLADDTFKEGSEETVITGSNSELGGFQAQYKFDKLILAKACEALLVELGEAPTPPPSGAYQDFSSRFTET